MCRKVEPAIVTEASQTSGVGFTPYLGFFADNDFLIEIISPMTIPSGKPYSRPAIGSHG
jgi:hypothetical protein